MKPKNEIGIEAAPLCHKDIIARQLVRDARLSLRALGLAVRLLSNAAGFTMTSADLARERPEGRDAIRAALKELEDLGYLRRYRVQLPNGRWVTKMVITEVPSPTPESPSSGPKPENPTPGNPGVGASGDKSSKSTIRKDSTRSTTTTHSIAPPANAPPDSLLHWPPTLTTSQVGVVDKVIAGLDRVAQQQLLDELAGALLGPVPPRQLASWMRALRRRHQRGEFIPDRALRIEQERDRRATEAARQQESEEEAARRNSPEARVRSAAARQRALAEIQRDLGLPSSEPTCEQRP